MPRFRAAIAFEDSARDGIIQQPMSEPDNLISR